MKRSNISLSTLNAFGSLVNLSSVQDALRTSSIQSHFASASIQIAQSMRSATSLVPIQKGPEEVEAFVNRIGTDLRTFREQLALNNNPKIKVSESKLKDEYPINLMDCISLSARFAPIRVKSIDKDVNWTKEVSSRPLSVEDLTLLNVAAENYLIKSLSEDSVIDFESYKLFMSMMRHRWQVPWSSRSLLILDKSVLRLSQSGEHSKSEPTPSLTRSLKPDVQSSDYAAQILNDIFGSESEFVNANFYNAPFVFQVLVLRRLFHKVSDDHSVLGSSRVRSTSSQFARFNDTRFSVLWRAPGRYARYRVPLLSAAGILSDDDIPEKLALLDSKYFRSALLSRGITQPSVIAQAGLPRSFDDLVPRSLQEHASFVQAELTGANHLIDVDRLICHAPILSIYAADLVNVLTSMLYGSDNLIKWQETNGFEQDDMVNMPNSVATETMRVEEDYISALVEASTRSGHSDALRDAVAQMESFLTRVGNLKADDSISTASFHSLVRSLVFALGGKAIAIPDNSVVTAENEEDFKQVLVGLTNPPVKLPRWENSLRSEDSNGFSTFKIEF